MGQKQSYDLTAAEADMNRRPSFEGTIDTACTTTGWAAMYSTRKSKKRDRKAEQHQDQEDTENIETTEERGIEVGFDKEKNPSVPIPTTEPAEDATEPVLELEMRVQEVAHCPLDQHITIQEVKESEQSSHVIESHHYDYVCGDQTERIAILEENNERDSRSHSIVVLKIGDDAQIIEEVPCEKYCAEDANSIQPESIVSFTSIDEIEGVETLNKRIELDQIPLKIKVHEPTSQKPAKKTGPDFSPIITREPKTYSSIDVAYDEREIADDKHEELSMDKDISHIETRTEPKPEEILVFQAPMATTNLDAKPTSSNYV